MSWTNQLLEDSAQVDLAAMVAQSWGFPRDITPNELERGVWFAMFRGCELSVVWWFETVSGSTTEAGIHIAADPRVRGRIPARSWQLEVVSHARRLGLQRLHASVEGEVVSYLLRLGWEPRQALLFMDVEASYGRDC